MSADYSEKILTVKDLEGISENELIGQYEYSVKDGLRFVVNSSYPQDAHI